MNETDTNRQPEYDKPKDDLVKAALSRIEQEVGSVIPSEFSTDTRRTVLGEVLRNARYVLGSLSVEQLQLECMVARHVMNAVATAQYLVDNIMAQRGRA